MKVSKILVADDSEDLLEIVATYLEKEGHKVMTTSSPEEVIPLIKRESPDVVLLDIKFGTADGLIILAEIKKLDPKLSVIMMTGHGTTQTAIEAMRIGAYDYILKPLQMDELMSLVARSIVAGKLMKESVVYLAHEESSPDKVCIIGKSREMLEIFKTIGKVAESNATVLIRGESGTGKELVARAIYQSSSRKEGPFLALNCAAIPETLLESELFGHEKGAFTGAHQKRIGKFQQCDGGTFFLDEVGDMALATQAKVLRVLQEQTFEPVGGSNSVKVDVRMIASTHKDLWKSIENKEFREDLYYRLKVVTIYLPPLRHRVEDIPLLVEYFVRKFNAEFGMNIKRVSPELLEHLSRYSWPGNVRELENAVQTAVVMSKKEVLLLENFPFLSMSQNAGFASDVRGSKEGCEAILKKSLTPLLNDPTIPKDAAFFKNLTSGLDKLLIEVALEKARKNQLEASKMLGINRNTLRKRMKLYGLSSE